MRRRALCPADREAQAEALRALAGDQGCVGERHRSSPVVASVYPARCSLGNPPARAAPSGISSSPHRTDLAALCRIERFWSSPKAYLEKPSRVSGTRPASSLGIQGTRGTRGAPEPSGARGRLAPCARFMLRALPLRYSCTFMARDRETFLMRRMCSAATTE